MEGNLADPAVIHHEGVYYLYATGEVDGDNGYRVYTSVDLVNWQRGPVVFRPGQRHIWAPDVWRDPDSGRFYLYYTANQTVGVADAAGPLGPFTASKKLFDRAIDAHLFRDDDGRLYLYVVQLPGFRITVQEMASPTEPAGQVQVVLRPEADWETRNGRVTEGPWMIKRAERYYLIYSGSGADTPDYAVGYATSDSPLGPFTRAENNPIIQRSDGLFGPGHGCAIRDADGQWWHIYHQKRTARREWDRFICLDPLHFDADGRLHGSATRGTPQPAPTTEENLWPLVEDKQDVHRFSTLVTAQQVRDYLGTAEGIDEAIEWCKRTGVTKVYLETFRSSYQAPREILQQAKERFASAGFDVSGCVTTTIVGKRSTGWNLISCYTDARTQEHLQEIFEFTAGLFDEIMIDDFWFTDCQCGECDSARKSQIITIGDQQYPVADDSWEDYRCELMLQLSRSHLLGAAKKVNPKATLIIKYPQWYDRFHERGYDVVRQTADFDHIWVGTETRDYDDARWGGTPQYEAYFIMRWLGGIGGSKCGGGWFDPFGTTEKTYLEQARQTVLAGARESMLFCYGALLKETGPANVRALRPCIPELLQVAEEVRERQIVGVAAYKPPNSHPENEARVFDFVGMMGVPLVPCHEFPRDAQAAFFSVHALKDPNLCEELQRLVDRGVPLLVTDGLAERVGTSLDLDVPRVRVLRVNGDPKSLLQLSQDQLDAIRQPLLEPFGRTLAAPNRVAIYLFEDGSWVAENFGDQLATISLDGLVTRVPARQWHCAWKSRGR
jgi:GH43 family beta-xylosidase